MFALSLIMPAVSIAQTEIKIPNVWPVPLYAPPTGQSLPSLLFTWDPGGYVWEALSGVVTLDWWGDRYGFAAIRLTEGEGPLGYERIFVADTDGSGPSFTDFGADWGTNVGREDEQLDVSQSLEWIYGADSTATLLDGRSNLIDTFAFHPTGPYVSTATQNLGAVALRTISYSYNDLPDPELAVQYGRSLSYPAHQFLYTHHI